MGKIYLVRHGQASLGAENYDQLSSLGVQQSARLGEYFRSCGTTFEAAYSGTLLRQQQTLSHILQGLALPQLHCTSNPALNEYDSHSIIRGVHSGVIPSPKTPEGYKEYFRLLRLGLLSWMTKQSEPENVPPFTIFSDGIVRLLKNVQAEHTQSVLIVSSGGPISTALAYLLGMSDAGRIELNLRLRNSSISELHFNPKAISVISFNSLHHLAQPEYTEWVTYA
jgi:broad specificity phosphatase PhoE